MKRIIFLTLFLLTCTTAAFSQVQEVKGVSSRILEYKGGLNNYYSMYGFEYENHNNFAVTVEAECWRSVLGQSEASNGEQPEPYILKTETFVIQPHGKYLWKAELTYPTTNGNKAYDGYYYTKFKAYKN